MICSPNPAVLANPILFSTMPIPDANHRPTRDQPKPHVGTKALMSQDKNDQGSELTVASEEQLMPLNISNHIGMSISISASHHNQSRACVLTVPLHMDNS
ncbi:hypothetical protein Vi05172_g6239 [Venturia inaequalis]|nr:hypothetical protein Vi05172_g6239 [Venturia inaequalis]